MAKKRRSAARTHPSRCQVSAIMIVRNEESRIARSLRSLAPLVDEIVVVDTGSTDATMDIVRAHGAKLFQFEWCDDFSAARNESMRQASGEWLIWVDADEELLETEPGTLRALCSLPDPPEGFLVTCKNLINEDGDFGTVIRQWRLFRNHLGLRFTSRIHEHLTHADGTKNANLMPQDYVWIRHWGYIVKGDSLKRKRERNIPLIELAIKDHPEDAFAYYNLGKQHLAEHDFEPGLNAMERAIELWTKQGKEEYAYIGNMFALAINAAVELQRNQRAVELEALVPPTSMSPDILFQAGVAWWRLGHREEGRVRLNRAWQDTSIRGAIESDPSHATWRPLAALADLHLELDQPWEAYEFAKKAIDYVPTMPALLYVLAFIAGRLKRYDESVDWARKLLALEMDGGFKPKARRILFNIGRGMTRAELVIEGCSGEIEGVDLLEASLAKADAHALLGEVQDQYEALETAHRSHPHDARVSTVLSELLDAQGYVDEAVKVIATAVDDPDAPAELYERLALLLTKQGQFVDAANALAISEQIRLATGPEPVGSR